MCRSTDGFTLVELLVAMALMGVLLAGAVGVFSSQNRTYVQEDLASSLEDNLRVGMGTLTDTMRTAGYGVPTSNLALWAPWVSGFNSNPTITGTTPPTISVASCFHDVATLSAAAAAGATSLPLASSVTGKQVSDLLDASNQSLILIDGAENARIVTATGSTLTIDTNPTLAGNQGLSRAYPAGAPICRVDIVTFTLNTDATTGVSYLGRDVHQGAGVTSVVEGISNLAIATVNAKQYQLTLTAASEQRDPVTGVYLNRSLTSNVTLKN